MTCIPQYQKYVSKNTVSHNVMKNKMQTLLATFTQDYLTFNCIDAAYTDLTTGLQDIVNEIALMKDIWVKVSSK